MLKKLQTSSHSDQLTVSNVILDGFGCVSLLSLCGNLISFALVLRNASTLTLTKHCLSYVKKKLQTSSHSDQLIVSKEVYDFGIYPSLPVPHSATY